MDMLKRLIHKKRKNPETCEVQILYSCNNCLGIIEEGKTRYNCVECEESYDLCQKCVEDGKGKTHTKEQGANHAFVAETRPITSILSLVLSGTSLEQLVMNMFKCYSARPAIGQYDKCSNSFKFMTFSEVWEMVTWFSGGLKKLMSSPSCGSDGTISMCSVSRLEWYITDLSCLLLGYTTVPLGTTTTKDHMEYILKKAEVNVLVCSLETLQGNLSGILSKCPDLKLLILMDIALTTPQNIDYSVHLPDHVQLVRFSEVLDTGKTLKAINFSSIKHVSNSMFTVQFTSGSTGDPKGCVFTRDTWKMRISKRIFLGYLLVWLSYHPPSHNLERKSFYVTLLNGGKIGMYRGVMEHLLDDFKLLRPTIIASTPRLWTSLYNQYLQALRDAFIEHQAGTIAPAMSASNSGKALLDGSASLEHFDPDEVPKEIVDQVMEKFSSKLGGRERMITTGGAPTAPAVLKFVIFCFKGMVNDGYGSTEVGGIASDGNIFNSNAVKLIDVPEMGYLTTDEPPRGEICVKNSEMINGYFKDPKVTAEKFVDGYFLTGDIGTINEFGKIKIIDRKKNIFKLSQGEFVSPESLENLYCEGSHFIHQIYVYGNSLHSNIVAVVVPDKAGVKLIAESLGVGDKDLSVLCGLDLAREIFMKELRATASKHLLPGWEVPAGILLESEPFSPENGLLTSTMKASRPRLEIKYRSALEELYAKFEGKRPLEIVIFEIIKANIQEDSVTKLHHEEEGSDAMLDKSFSELGGDSLSAMLLSSLLGEHLHLDVPAEVILKTPLKSIISANAIENAHFGSNADAGSRDLTLPDWSEEASLKGFLEEVEDNPPFSRTERASCVLLTGSTGFLGRFILSELLLDPNVRKVFCLVQEKNDLTPIERIQKVLLQLEREMENPKLLEASDKMKVVAGNLAELKLGLNSKDYDELCESVDTIIHNGAVVNSVLPYPALKKSNVDSAKELIKMAMLRRPKFLHFVSTIGIFPYMNSHIDESTTPPVARLNSLSGYSQSKWVAESLVIAAIQEGKIKGNISRPGLVGPHSDTGHSNLQDWVCWLVRGLARLGLMPEGQGCEEKVIYWVPVDQVAKAIVFLSCEANRGEFVSSADLIYHLVNDKSPTAFTALTDSLAAQLPSSKTSSYEEFRKLLSERVKLGGDVVLGKMDLILPQTGGWPVSVVSHSQKHKVQQLQEAGISFEHLPNDYVRKYMKYVLELAS